MTRLLSILLLLLLALPIGARAQRAAKYGADFLAGGVGARALAMGGAHVALSKDVNAVYWNPAGLEQLVNAEVAYMHAERFAGVVSFDYGAGAIPITERSSVGVAFFRSGVNDIANTLDAWDADRDQPRPNPQDFISTFSAADYAFLVSYSRTLSTKLQAGVSVKLIRRKIGDFADAWGYSFDLGARYSSGRLTLAATVQDVSTMLQSWSVNRAALANIEDVFGDELPSGGTEIVLPVVRLGSGYALREGEHAVLLGFDLDLAFDGQSANVIDLGDGAVSFHPRLGAEYSWRDLIALRAGISRVLKTATDGLDFTPTVGAGLHLGGLQIDYGFGDFAGLVSSLGYSHRVSIQFGFSGERFVRPSAE